jgi:hypothetical protein
MLAADGFISRDEMIVGPLKAASDRSPDSIAEIVSPVKSLRSSKAAVEKHLESVAREGGIRVNTLHNYTRWPIAVLRDCGWATKRRTNYRNGRSFQASYLTSRGKSAAESLLQIAELQRCQSTELVSSAETECVLARSCPVCRQALSKPAQYSDGRSSPGLRVVHPRLRAKSYQERVPRGR